jgi:hypothetical protein
MENTKDLIIKLIKEKSVLKQDVYFNTVRVFKELKEVLASSVEEIKSDFGKTDPRVEFYYRDRNEFQAEIKIAGDILVFFMHTNVFQFDRSHSLWRSGYLKDHPENSYIGVINVYNFLADSFKYQRNSDIGYLIARIFVNRENHFQVQGKRQLGFLYNDFVNSTIDKAKLAEITNSAILYTLDFDMYAPPYETLQEVTVEQMESLTQSHAMATGKRMGFRFGLDEHHV